MKIFHISDVHINHINGQYGNDVRVKLQDELKNAFSQAVNTAISSDVDVFIIAGDLFDGPDYDYSIEKFLIAEARRLERADIITVVSNGNHDPAEIINMHKIFKNAIIFDGEDVSTYSCRLKNNETLLISGCGFSKKTSYVNPLSRFPKRKINEYHIGVIHGTLKGGGDTNHEPYMPFEVNDLRFKDYNYWALGHIHKREYFEHVKAAYAGSIQGKNKKETGVKGGYLVELHSPDAMPSLQFIPLSNIVFEKIEHDVPDRVHSLRDLEKLFLDALTSKVSKHSYQYIIEWKIKGFSPIYNVLKNEDIASFVQELRTEARLLHLHLDFDELKPMMDRDAYINASPFLKMIDVILTDENKRDEFFSQLDLNEFVELPVDAVQRRIFLENLLNEVGDEWMYRLVK